MTPELEPLRVVGLCGSLRAKSHTRAALAVALQGAARAGAETTLVDLRDFELPLQDGSGADEGPEAVRLQEAVKDAQGLIWATPEYHGGYSGVLKNALDLLGFDEVEGKVVGLVGVAGGAMGGFGPVTALRDVGRSLHAWVVPTQALVPHARKVFDENGAPTDPRIAARLEAVGAEVARFARLHRAAEDDAFVTCWEEAVENPGGG